MGPYTTTVGRQFIGRVEEIKKGIEEQLVLGGENQLKRISSHIYVTTADNEKLDHWSHPIFHNGNVYIDGRPFYNKSGGIRNMPEYRGLVQRAYLEYLWQTNPDAYDAVMRPTTLVFSQWISNSLASRFAMPATDGAVIRIISAIYYLALYLEASGRKARKDYRIDPEELETLCIRLLGARGGWIPPQMISDVLESAEVKEWMRDKPTSLEAMCLVIRQTVSTHMGQFNSNTLIQLMGSGSWIGHEAVGLSVMALEYPPVLCQMVALAETTNMYKSKTRIGRTCASMQRTANLKAVVSFLGDIEDADESI